MGDACAGKNGGNTFITICVHTHGMPRKQRVNFSLDPEIVERLEDQVEYGKRSETVEHALQKHLDDE